MLSDFKQSLEAQGGDFDTYMQATGTTVEQMIDDLKPAAASNVKTGLVLDAVAKAEGLEATDEDVSAVVAQMAAAGRVDAKDLRASACGRPAGSRPSSGRSSATRPPTSSPPTRWC